jgi:hypothetical protein
VACLDVGAQAPPISATAELVVVLEGSILNKASGRQSTNQMVQLLAQPGGEGATIVIPLRSLQKMFEKRRGNDEGGSGRLML